MENSSTAIVVVAMCMVLLALPAAAQSGNTPPSEMSDSELKNSFGDTLREYDSNNNGEIGFDERNEASTDFAQSELSQRKLDAVSEAHDENLFFDTARQFSAQEYGAATETKSVTVGQEFTFTRGYRDSAPVDKYELSLVDANDGEVELVPKTQELRDQRPDGQMKFTVYETEAYRARLSFDNTYRIVLNGVDSSNGVQSADIQMIAPDPPEEGDNSDTESGGDESVRQFSVQEYGAATESKSVTVGQKFAFIRSYNDSQPVDVYELSSVDASDNEVELVPKTQELRDQRPDGQMKFTVITSYLAKLPVDNPYRIVLNGVDSSNGVQSADIQMIAPGPPEGEGEDNGDTDTDSDDTESGDDDSDGEVKQIETGSWVDVSVGDTFVFGPEDQNELTIESIRGRESEDSREMGVMPGIGSGTNSDDPIRISIPEGQDSAQSEIEFNSGSFKLKIDNFKASEQFAIIKIVDTEFVEETDPSELEASDFTPVDYQFGELINVSSGEVLEIPSTNYVNQVFIKEVDSNGDGVDLFEYRNGEYFKYENMVYGVTSYPVEFKLADGSKARIYTCSSDGEEARINITEAPIESEPADIAVACGRANQQEDQEGGDDSSSGPEAGVSFKARNVKDPQEFSAARDRMGYTSAVTGYNINLLARFYTDGKYRVEISGAGLEREETYTSTVSTGTWESQSYNIKPTQGGDLNVKVVAPGSWWNPLDDDQEVASASVTVSDPQRVDVEAGEKFTLNRTQVDQSRAAVLPDGTSIIPGGYYDIGPPYDEEPEGMDLLVNNTLRKTALALDDPDKDLPVNRQITIGGIKVRLCGYKSPGEYHKQPRFVTATHEIMLIYDNYLVNKCNGEAVDLSNSPVSMSNQELFNEYGDIMREYDADNSAAYTSDEIDDFIEAAVDGDVTDSEIIAVNVGINRDTNEELWYGGSETEDDGGEEEDTQGISVDVVSQEPYNVGQEIEFEALGESGDAEFEWDFNQDYQPDAQGSTATYTYTESGQKTIQLNLSDQSETTQTTITVQSQTGEDETSSQQTELSVSTSDPYTTDKEIDLGASATESLVERGYRIKVSGPDGFSESKDVSEPEAELSFTPPSSGTYTAKVVPQNFRVQDLTQGAVKAETTFEVADPDTSAWIDYCNSNGYDVESLDGESANNCVDEQIVPAFFLEGGEVQNVEVPESICQDVDDTGYIKSQRKCGSPETE